MMVWKMIFLFQGCILRFHVKLQGCTKNGRSHLFQGPIILGLSKPLVEKRGWKSWDVCIFGDQEEHALHYTALHKAGVSDVLCFVFGFLKEERDVDVQIPMPRLNPLIPKKMERFCWFLLALRKDEAVVHNLS